MSRRSIAPRPQGPYPPDALLAEPEAVDGLRVSGVGSVCDRCYGVYLAAKLQRVAICPNCRKVR